METGAYRLASTTRSQPVRWYWFCDARGKISSEIREPNDKYVKQLMERYGAHRSLSLKWVEEVEVYQFTVDVIDPQLPLSDMETYFKTHQTEFNRLSLASILPASKDTERLDCACLDLFLRLPPASPSPDPKAGDDLTTIPATRYKALVDYARCAKVPSESYRAATYKADQGHDRVERRFFDGRYDIDSPMDNTGVPIEIFHNCFAEFQRDAQTAQVTPATMLKVTGLFDKSSAIYANEEDRLRELRPCLSDLLGFSLLKVENTDKTVPDSTHSIDIPTDDDGGISRAILVVHEGTGEFGKGGLSPDIQGEHSVRRTWFQEISIVAANRCCCPTFIIATSGPYLMVLGIVITQSIFVRRLTPWLPMVNVSYDTWPYEQVARVIIALRNSIQNLTKFWSVLPIPKNPYDPSPSRFLPWRTSYEVNGSVVNFEYLHALDNDPSTVTFLARHVEGDKGRIVVKFVMSGRYGEEPHKLLADHNFAPPLLYFGPLSSSCDWLSMVVMGYVDGYCLSDRSPPPGLHMQLENALKLLHSENFVFGDLRAQNIMVDKEEKLKLIDMNWAGLAGEARYPYRMNMDVQWAPGMAPGMVMNPQHDLDMLQQLGLAS